MNTLEALRAFCRYQTHGGYTWGAVLSDGAVICENCARENYRQVYRETRDAGSSGWCVIGLTNSGECESPENCAHCNRELWSVND
jgi:hypothetical protein